MMSQSSSSDAVSHIIDQSVAHMLTPLELRMLCNTAIIIRHEVFELVADGDLFLPLTRKVSSSSGEECGKGTGEVALSGELVDQCSSNIICRITGRADAH